MYKNLNRAQLIGNLGKDPTITRNQKDQRFARFRIATTQSYMDKASGEERSFTQWHQIFITIDSLVDIAEKHLRKGSRVYIEGQIEPRSYKDATGRDVYVTEIVVRRGMNHQMLLIGSLKEGADEAEEISGEDWAGILDDEILYQE